MSIHCIDFQYIFLPAKTLSRLWLNRSCFKPAPVYSGNCTILRAVHVCYDNSPRHARFSIGERGVVEADLELFGNCWSAGFLGERL